MATAVRYGRRSTVREEAAARDEKSKSMTILSEDDMRRIHNNLSNISEEARLKQEEARDRERLNMLSKDRVSHWENTIEGQRIKKLHAHEVRAAAEEAEKQKLDLEEARIQSEARTEAITRAKLLQYYQTDRVRNFHSALVLSDVLKERDAQLNKKRFRNNYHDEFSHRLYEADMLAIEAATKSEEEKLKVQRQKNIDCRRYQKCQAESRRASEDEEQRLALERGRSILADAELYKEEQRIVEEKRRKVAREQCQASMNQMALSRQWKEEEAVVAAFEDEKIRSYTRAKEGMLATQKEREIARREEKRIIRERVAYEQHAKKEKTTMEEDARIQAYIELSDAKKQAAADAKAQATLSTLQSIRKHRIRELESKKLVKEEHLKLDREMLELRVHDFEKYQAEQAKQRIAHREAGKKLEAHYARQIEQRHAKDRAEIEKLLAADRRQQEMLEAEERDFQVYAKKVTEDWAANGKNVKPMLKVTNQRPPKQREREETGLRLGFCADTDDGSDLPPVKFSK